MKNLKYLIGVIIVVDLVLVFPVMFSWQAIGKYLKVAAFPEVFTTLVVEITLRCSRRLSLTWFPEFSKEPLCKKLFILSLGAS